MKLSLTLLLVLFTILGVALSQNLVLNSVSRHIDLSSQLAKHQVTLEISNSGSSADNLEYAVEQANHLSFYGATVDSAQLTVSELSGQKTTPDGRSYRSFTISFAKPLGGGDNVKITVTLHYTHTMTPFPATIEQHERQLVKYQDSHVLFTPYITKTQKTTVQLADKLESHTERSPFSVRGNNITYGPYENVEAFSHSDLSIHFENESPFVVFTRLEREIEISHWGNAAFEETYEWVHQGAKLTGVFSRYSHQRALTRSSVRSLTNILPPHAADVYYRDEIGNISTSHVREEPNRVVMEILPRFPLFGGWKTNFYMGYNLPLADVLAKNINTGNYHLTVAALPTYEHDVVVDDFTVRFVLPEGATNIKVNAPWGVDSQGEEKRYTYLDTNGRPVLYLSKKNLVAASNKNIVVTYSFSTSSMMREGFLLIGGFFVLFLMAIVGVRIRLSIAPESADEAQKDKRIKGLLSDLKSAHDKLSKIFGGLKEALEAKSGKQNLKNAQDGVRVQINQAMGEIKRVKGIFEEIDEDLAFQVESLLQKEQDREGFIRKLVDLELSRNKEGVEQVYSTTKTQSEQNLKAIEQELAGLVDELTSDL